MFKLLSVKKACLPKKINQKPKQIFDLLQLSRKERECRAACLRSIRRFEAWKKAQQKITEPSLKFYLQLEGVMLRRQAQDEVLFYRIMRKDRIRLFQDYTTSLPNRSSLFRAAS